MKEVIDTVSVALASGEVEELGGGRGDGFCDVGMVRVFFFLF